jgi:hypothetical protein
MSPNRPQDSAPEFIRILNSTIFLWIEPLYDSLEQVHFSFTTTLSSPSDLLNVIVCTDNQIVTYPIDKRFGLLLVVIIW